MEVIYLLIPLSLVFIGVIIYAFFWAIRSGQFDDMEGSGFQILMDDDRISSDEGEKDETEPDPEEDASRRHQ